MTKTKFDALSTSVDLALAWNAAAFVVFQRTIDIQSAMLKGDPSGGPEARRMVNEKLAAAQEGTIDAWRAACGVAACPPMTLAAAQLAAAKVVNAAMRPAIRRARANARRLAK